MYFISATSNFMKFQLANRLLETNRATHTRTQREKERGEKDLEGTLGWLGLNLEVPVTVACFRWEAADFIFMSKTPLFGLEKLKVYLIKILLAKGLGPLSFALSCRKRRSTSAGSGAWARDKSVLEWRGAGGKGSDIPMAGIRTDSSRHWRNGVFLLKKSRCLCLLIHTFIHSFNKRLLNGYWVPDPVLATRDAAVTR